jgi:hypothetical protein
MIYVCDAIMGSGKTQAAINFAHENRDTPIIYAAQYLSEADRFAEACPWFEKPTTSKQKLEETRALLLSGSSIATTHAMLGLFDNSDFDLIRCFGYTLIMDELMDMVGPLRIPDGIMELAMDARVIQIDDFGRVFWASKKLYNGDVLARLRETLLRNSVIWVNDGASCETINRSLIDAFQSVYILTYMFAAQPQSLFFRYYNMPYQLIGVDVVGDGCCFGEYHAEEKLDVRSRLEILDDATANDVGAKATSLSLHWYQHSITKTRNKLRGLVRNVFERVWDAPHAQRAWTTFADLQGDIEFPGIKKCFVQHNQMSTNEYMDRTHIAYLINKHLHPSIYSFGKLCNTEIDRDKYALQSMLQFIWRFAIRRGEKIHLYIPSKRMRNLLLDWIDEVDINGPAVKESRQKKKRYQPNSRQRIADRLAAGPPMPLRKMKPDDGRRGKRAKPAVENLG